MTFDTLQYVDGSGTTQEIALSLANLATGPAVSVRLEPASHAPGRCTITWAQAPETGIAVPFKSRCVVWANRASATGANNSFSGGGSIFIGRRTDNAGSASASRISTTIVLEDFLWDLGKITYQQASNQVSGGTLSSPTYTPFYWPDVVLFQALPGTSYTPAAVNGTINTWQQIQDILNYAQSFATGVNAVQFQFSTSAEFQPLYRNWYPLRSAKCLEAIVNCLRTHPGVYTEVDYTTTLAGQPCPTIHFRNAAYMTALTLPYASTDSAGCVHLATDIQPLPDLIPDAVRLYYRVNGTFNGQPIVSPGTDIYPVAAANSLLCFDYSIDVTGATQTETIKNFTSSAFNPASLTLWRQRVAGLHQINQGGQIPNDGNAGAIAFVSSAAYNSGSNPKGIQVLGDDGVDYSSTYGTLIPYITDDSISSWFQLSAGTITVKTVTVKAYFSYKKQTTIGSATITDQVQEHQHTFRCVLCSIPSGQYILKQVLNSGESIPANLAQYIWTELQTLQWKMTHNIWQVAASGSATPTIVKPGLHKINLAGGAAAWTTMNAIPQRVTVDLMRVLVAGVWTLAAKTTVSCGPVSHLNPDQLVQLASVFRMRGRDGIDASSRLTGNVSSTQVDLSISAQGKENSMPAPALPSIHNIVAADATSGNNNQISGDATVARFTVNQLNAGTGANITSGTIAPEYTGSGAPSGSTLPANSYYRVGDHYVDTSASALWRCTTAGSNSASAWSQISGGGGGTVVEIYNNAHNYSVGNIVFVFSPTVVGSVTILPGAYICVVSVTGPGTGNQIPQYPLPVAGTVYWYCIAMGISVVNTCSAGAGAQIYLNSSGTF